MYSVSRRSWSRRTRAFGTAVPLTFVVLLILVGVSHAHAPERGHARRQASLTPPTVSLSEPSGSGTSSNLSILPIATTTTELTTSIGPNGTSTFLTTVTTLFGPGPSNATTTTSENVSATASTTSTAYPSLGSYSSCVDDCLQASVSSSNCSSVTDTSCYCVSSAFTATLVQCVSSQCNDELTTAEKLAQAFCNLSSPSVSLAFPAPSISADASGTEISASASASATGNAAVRLRYDPGAAGVKLDLILGAMGIILGALLC